MANPKALYFEAVSITLLFGAGGALIAHGLPGWGLVSVAAVLTGCSLGLRLVPAPQPAAADALLAN